MTLRNPILRGFNPDPSIVRVGDDYYIATSTFEWFPGVQIHHSRDLANWRLVGRPLTRPSQLDMRGNPDSCGVWAPDLFRKNEVGTVAGMAGLCANFGVLLFTLAIGTFVATIGYSPFFIALGLLDLLAAAVLWTLVRAPKAGTAAA